MDLAHLQSSAFKLSHELATRPSSIMRNFLSLILIGVCFSFTITVSAQRELKRLKPKSPIVCYKSFVDNPVYFPPAEKFVQMRENASGRTKTATIEVDYIGFPADNLAKNAFQFAVDIWETELKSSVPIRIRAQWGQLGTGVLGQAIWGTAVANFDNATPHLNTFYAIALAEKIAGRALNANDEPDIVATFNSGTNWYYQTTGTPGSGQMDLVTIVLHEIAHGLGFTDTYDVDEGQGSVGLESGGVPVPFVYDLFIEKADGTRLFSDMQSPSTALATAITSDDLYYFSPTALAAAGSRPIIYAPSPFNGGSSIAHLDEDAYSSATDPNRLMTPQIDFQERIHNPGDLTRGILSDMGWVFTKIDHVLLTDTERKDGQPYPIVVKIQSDNGYDAATVKLHYTVNGTTFTTLAMSPTGTPNQFAASLPGTTVDLSYGYFVSVEDVLDREFTLPGKVQAQGKDPVQDFVVVNIGPDDEKPTIVHTPIDFVFEGDTQLQISAQITDNIAVEGAHVEYSIKGGGAQSIAMTKGAEDNYSATINIPSTLVIGDKIEYRIVASDVSSNSNESTVPASGFFNVFVTGTMPTQDSYTNDFDTPTNDFIGNSFNISTPSGFDNPAIHSKHPYDNGSGAGNQSNYVYQLQIPIRINPSNPYIRFDEIVLVEPGETGAAFGSEEFYDYVVVEGSKDGGTTWTPFQDGYDSRALSVWLNRYNSATEGDNSTAVGDPTLYRQRSINMIAGGDFADGDEVLIRFRLFADQLAHGWGWAIDNLFIQDAVTGIEEEAILFSIYPNPAKENITIEFDRDVRDARIQIINLQGASIIDAKTSSKLTVVEIGNLQQGIYILKTQLNNKTVIQKFIKH
jgi:hypothetical protein